MAKVSPNANEDIVRKFGKANLNPIGVEGMRPTPE